MEINLISVGKISCKWISDALLQYEPRLHRYIKFKSIIIPDVKNASSLSVENIKEEEGKMISKVLMPSDFVVILDEKGKEYTSREFSVWMNKNMLSGRKRLVFVVGGPFGFSNQIYDRADSKIALSKLTFTHEMAKLLLTEQLYRCFTILNGEPYHHD